MLRILLKFSKIILNHLQRINKRIYQNVFIQILQQKNQIIQQFLIHSKEMSNLKQIRKIHYTSKYISSYKHSNDYDPYNKLPQEAIYLLNHWLPKASLKQLTNFMLKKYSRVLKNCPIIESALKKVIKDRLNALPKEFETKQGEKIMNYIKQNYPLYEFQNDGKSSYILKKINSDNEICTYVQKWGGISIRKMKKCDIKVIPNKDIQNREYFLFEYNDADWIDHKYFANPEKIVNEGFGISNGNFLRQASRILDILNRFQLDMKAVESQNL